MSNLLSGLIGDRFEQSNPMIKGWITTLSTALSLPMMMLACAGKGFYTSIFAIAAYVLISGGYHSTAVTMIENSARNSDETSRMVSSW